MDKGDRKLHASKAHKEEESFLNRRKELFRRLPKIDRLMGRELTKELTEQYGYRAVLEAARKVEEQLRDAMRQQILAEEKPAVFLDTSGIRNFPPISTSSPRETTVSPPEASAVNMSSTAAALLFTAMAASAPVSLQRFSAK